MLVNQGAREIERKLAMLAESFLKIGINFVNFITFGDAI